jgi:hypothetical protein
MTRARHFVTPAFILSALIWLAPGMAQRIEVEPNDSKAEATLIPNLQSGEAFTGFQLSGTTDGSRDYFRVQTAPAPLGIYRHRLRTVTPGPGGANLGHHFPSIRGQRFENGVVTGVEDFAQSGVREGDRFNDYYAFGKAESLYFRIDHQALPGADIGEYRVTLTTFPVTPVNIGLFIPGTITIDTRERARNVSGGQHNTDLWIYDSQFNAIPDYGNDTSTDGAPFNSGAKLTRTYQPGTYFMALGAYDLINDQVNPPDDPSRLVGTVLDFPNAVLSSYEANGSQAGSDLDFGVTDRAGTREFSAVKPDSVYGVYWARFQVASFGDANLNGAVNLDDFNILAANFGQSGANWQQGDFNGDGRVSLDDFNLLAANFGATAGPNGPTAQDWGALGAAVPEPAGLLTLLTVAALSTRRRAATGKCRR